MTEDEKYMWRCLQLASCGWKGAPPNPMVGAVIVNDGKIIGEGFHRRCGEGHAEVNAFASVRDERLLPGSTIYVSLEPCSHYGKTPPCADLIVSKGVSRVVVGCLDPFPEVSGRGVGRLRQAGIDVTVGVLEQECMALNAHFMTFHRLHRPFVTLKWAQTMDGFIGEYGRRMMISNPLTSVLAHRRRAEHQAILVGTTTAINDNPQLSLRHWPGHQPLRIVIDRNLRISPSCHLLNGSQPTWVVCGKNVSLPAAVPETLVYKPAGFNGSIIRWLLAELYSAGIQSLLVEGGAQTHQAFINERLWDEAYMEVGTKPSGRGVAAPTLTGAVCFDECELGGAKILHFRANKGE